MSGLPAAVYSLVKGLYRNPMTKHIDGNTRAIHRRRFLLQTMTASLALPALSAQDAADISHKPRRVGLIGSGWYGPSDLWRLIQVAPAVEVISLCDPDKRMLESAVTIASQRQKSKKAPRLVLKKS